MCILFAVNFLKEITLNVAAEYMINNNTLQQENPALLSMNETKNKIMGPSWKNYKITGHSMRSMCKKRRAFQNLKIRSLLRISFIFRA